jgi:hypothetical protein
MTGPFSRRVNAEPAYPDEHAHRGDDRTMSNSTTLDSIRRQAEGTLDGPAPTRPAAPPTAAKVCPYCGHRAGASDEECPECRGLFEPLSRIATQNAMGPWQIRDESNPFRPGCSLDTLRAMIRRGKLTRETVLRGPTTNQFWTRAADIQGVAHLLGSCHACAGKATPSEHFCRTCGASFVAQNDRNWMGLDAVRPLTTGVGNAVEHKPSGRAPNASEPTPASPSAEPRANQFAELFAPSAEPSGAPTSRRSARESRRRANAVGHAVAAATVALCAAALSVAVWAASAAQSVNANADPAPLPDAAQGAPGAAAGSLEGESATYQTQSEPPAADLDIWRVRLETAASLGAADDIASLEQAIAILREVLQEAPPAAKPSDLGDQIEALERRVDDLTIRKFLRDDR